MERFQYLVRYTIAFFIIQGIFNYWLHLPHKITQQEDLVNKYYYTNFRFTIPLDYILILGYILASRGVIQILGINDSEFASHIAIVMLCTVMISGGFAYYFRSQTQSNNFFSELFHKSGYRLVVNDILIVTMTFVLFMVIYDYF